MKTSLPVSDTLAEGGSSAGGPSPVGDGASTEVLALRAAFQAFQRATEELRTSYDELQERVRSLNLELEEKNRALQSNLEEKELMRRHLHEILESLTTGVVVFNEEGRLTMLNGAAKEISGYTREEMCSAEKTIALLLPSVDTNSSAREEISGVKAVETTFRRKDGRVTSLRVAVTPLMDLEGRGAGLILLFEDITRTKRMAEKAERASRLTAMGEMASNIAHEIRNPLGSIELFAGCLSRNAACDSEAQKVAGHICRSVKSLNNVLSNVLHFANPLRPRFARLDVHAVLRDALSFAAPVLRQQGVRLQEEFLAGDGEVLGDAELLWQVFYNMILNAAQAMPEGGTLTVATSWCNGPAEPCKRDEGIAGSLYERILRGARSPARSPQEASWLTIRFIDAGSGMSLDTLARIFDPFFTTKSQGTGLGLSIANAIVESHRGMIEVDSCLGEGSVFTISLPPDGISLTADNGGQTGLSAAGSGHKPGSKARAVSRIEGETAATVRGEVHGRLGKEGTD